MQGLQIPPESKENLSGLSISMDRKTAFALIIGLLTATGVWLLKISTPSGLGLTDDAISYIAASRALLAGQGFTRIWLATGLEPITHWPPGFSATLATLSLLLKIDPYRSARFLNILIFGANAGVLALLGYKLTHSRLAGIFLSLLFLSNTAFLRLHAQALSEPLYLFVSLLAFLSFYQAFENNHHMGFQSHTKKRKPAQAGSSDQPPSVGFVSIVRGLIPTQRKWLILAGFLTGLSYLTRYAALSLIATFVVSIFILRPTWKNRFSSLAFFLAGALPPILAWMLRNKLVGGTATNRAVLWHPVTLENTKRGLRSFFQFIFPLFNKPEISVLAIIPLFFSITLLIWVVPRGIRYFLKPEKNTRPEILPFITTLYIFSYMGSLLVSLSLFDAATPLNDRILSPVYLAFFIMLVYFTHKFFERGKIIPRILIISFTLFLLSTSTIAQIRTVDELQESAMGFASWRWRESTVMATIRELPEGTAVYTNQPPAVYFWTGRPVNSIWGSEQADDLRSGDAAIAIFFPGGDDSPKFQTWLAKMTEGLDPIQKSGLGNLYQKSP